MDAAAEPGRNLVSKHQIQPDYGDEFADAGLNCRACLSRETIFSAANGDDRERLFFSVQLTTSRIGNFTRLIYYLALCGNNSHKYIQTSPHFFRTSANFERFPNEKC